MTEPVISIPRLPNERAERHEARVLYLSAGADRSLATLARKLSKSVGLLCRWSAADGWSEQARSYDSTLANLATRAHEAAYRADLLAHRSDAARYGKDLCAVAVAMLAQLQAQHKTIEYTPAALGAIGRALTTGLDLRAHALDLDRLLPTLDSAEPAAQLLSAEARTESDVRAILATLPADVRAAIIALARDAELDT